MVVAYVMVKAHTAEADRLKADTGALEGVVSAHIVAGDVDLIAKVEVDSPAEVKEIASAVREFDGVENTKTYIAMG